MLRELCENPIFVRSRQVEKRCFDSGFKSLLHRYGWAFVLLFGPLGLCLSLSADRPAAPRELLAPVMALSGLMLVVYCTFRALGSTFSAVSLEKEQRTYDPLLGTLLSPREVVCGKLAAALWPAVRELLAMTPAALVLGGFAGCLPQTALFVLLCGACIFFFGLLGLWTSFGASSTRRASRAATTLAAMFLLGGPVIDGFLLVLTGPYGLGEAPLGSLTSPLAAAGSILGGAGTSWAGTLALYGGLGILLWWSCLRAAQQAEER